MYPSRGTAPVGSGLQRGSPGLNRVFLRGGLRPVRLFILLIPSLSFLTQQKAALDQLVDSVGPQDSDTESGDGLPGILCIR